MSALHFIAIGGAAMHNLAIALQQNGHTVSGSDDEIYEPARSRLAAHNLLPDALGWHPERLHTGIAAVILGMHARADNPELHAAQQLGLPIYSYPAYIYEQSKNKTRIVVAGSHGKTTTTAMLLHALHQNGIDTDYLVGAQLEGFDTMARLSNAPYIVIEGDEYLASALQPIPKFHCYYPHIAIITGIAWDHINVFPTFASYVAQFARFTALFAPSGKLFYYENDVHCREIAATTSLATTPYGSPMVRIENGASTVIATDGRAYPMQIFGKYNFENMNAARLVCAELGVTESAFYTAMQSFGGAAKRQQLLHESATTAAYLDFAHAPSKVRATVGALRAQYPDRRLVACLELHTFSSLTDAFLPEYAGSLAAADIAVVFYSPHTLAMKKMPPLVPAVLSAHFAHPQLTVLHESAALRQFLEAIDWQNTNLLLMTSGNFGNLDYDDLFV